MPISLRGQMGQDNKQCGAQNDVFFICACFGLKPKECNISKVYLVRYHYIRYHF